MVIFVPSVGGCLEARGQNNLERCYRGVFDFFWEGLKYSFIDLAKLFTFDVFDGGWIFLTTFALCAESCPFSPIRYMVETVLQNCERRKIYRQLDSRSFHVKWLTLAGEDCWETYWVLTQLNPKQIELFWRRSNWGRRSKWSFF